MKTGQQMKAWMVRGGFMEGWSLGENAGEYTEDMLFAEFTGGYRLRGRYCFLIECGLIRGGLERIRHFPTGFVTG